MNIKVKEFIKKEWLSLLLILSMFVVGQWVAPILPERVPIHWNVYGQVDNEGSKLWAILWLPLLTLGMYALFFILPLIDPKKKNYNLFEGSYRIIRSIIIIFFAALYAFTIATSLGYGLRADKVVPIAVAVLFMVLGNYMGRIKQNFFVGIKTPWTLSDPEVWNKTHRVSGQIWVAGGLLLILTSIFLKGVASFAIFMGVTLVMVFVPIIYSYILYAKRK